MSINENAIIDAVLAHMTTVGYKAIADESGLADFSRYAKPFAFVSGVNTIREPIDDAQTNDQTSFELNLWEDSGKRAKVIADIQAFIALLEGDTTLGGVCDLCQAGDAAQIVGQNVEGQMTYWTLDVVAVFES